MQVNFGALLLVILCSESKKSLDIRLEKKKKRE